MVPQMVDTKLMTRETYTLYGIEGDFGNKDGKLTFTEKVRQASVVGRHARVLIPSSLELARDKKWEGVHTDERLRARASGGCMSVASYRA